MVIKQIKLVLNLEQILNIMMILNLGLEIQIYYEKIETDSTASARQKSSRR